MARRSSILDAILFDVDGVIVETENIHRMAYNEAFKTAGVSIEWTPEEYAARLAKIGRTKLGEVAESLGVPNKEAFVEHLYMLKKRFYLDHIESLGTSGRIEVLPGVLRLIREALEAGVKVGVATACPRDGAERLLHWALGPGLLSQFGAFCASEDVDRRKPAPDIYLLTLQKLGADPQRSVAIEDTVHGLEAAHAAGIKCVVTPSEYTLTYDFTNADLVVKNLDCYTDHRPVDLAVLESLFLHSSI